MARIAKPRTNTIIQDPRTGTVLTAVAGGTVEAEFSFNNDTPDVAAFMLDVQGLPPDWITGTGAANESMAAAFGGSSLRLGLTPPVTAEPGEYDLQIRILCGTDVIGPPVALILQVDPPVEEAIPEAVLEPVPEPIPEPVAVIPTPEPLVSKTTRRPAVKQNGTAKPPDPEIVAPAPEAPAPTEAIALIAAPSSAPVVPEPVVPIPPPVQREPEVVPEPPAAQAPPPVARLIPSPRPRPEPLAPPVVPIPRPVPRAVPAQPVDDDPVLVDVPEDRYRRERDEEEAKSDAVTEAAIADPQDGQVILVRPGETMLLRFRFLNDGTRPRTYILDEDRSLPESWIKLVQDQVNLSRNGTGEVSLRLTPPHDADPGEYPFGVTVGPEGGVLAPRSLVLSVAATPAVKLSAKAATVSFGPLATAADFHLSVESDGNSDTAYRVGVLAPRAEAEDGAATSTREYTYETLQWRYLFDKEMDTLRSPAAGRAPRAIPITLRLQRRGPWWLGWKESHKVDVAAVPVTDPANGTKKGNRIELTAVRWRILPFPTLFLIPIVLLFTILLSGGASSLAIDNALSYGGAAYVLQTSDIKEDKAKPNVPMTAELRWDAPWYALLRLKAVTGGGEQPLGFVHNGSASETYPVTEYGAERTYTISPVFVSGNTGITARFVPVRTDNRLQLAADGRPVDLTPADLKIGSDTVPGGASSATVEVPQSGTLHLSLHNTSDGLRVIVWVAHTPPGFSVSDVTIDTQNAINPGEMITAKIRQSGDASPDDDELTLITTDAAHQVIHLHLKP